MTDRPTGCSCSLPWRVCCYHYSQLSEPEKARVRSGARLWSHIHDKRHRDWEHRRAG